MMLPDEVIDFVAEEYRRLNVHLTSITFAEFLESWANGNGYKGVA